MEKGKDRIKILISHHKQSEMIESRIMMPIQVGAKNSAVDLNVQRDDEGINISEKNDKYCELTAQYWAWKNLDADYYGFMHYRRHFAFQDIEYPYDDGEPVLYPCINQAYLEALGLEDDAICRCVEGCDLVLPMPVDMLSFGAMSNEIQYSCMRNLHAKDFAMVCQTVINLYPDYRGAVQEFRLGRFAYWYNMFIMKKELFIEYSQWLFRILEEAEGKIDFSRYDQQESRTLAFMAERLLSIFVIKLLKDRPFLKFKHLAITFVNDTDVKAGEKWEGSAPVRKITSNLEYVSSVEKAYQELQAFSLPYDMESLFSNRNFQLSTFLREKRLIFYGGGNWCRQLLSYFDRLGIQYPVEIWDKDAEAGQTIKGIQVVKPNFDSISMRQDILWIITVFHSVASDNIKRDFFCHGAVNVVENRELVGWLSYQLWMCVKNETT